MRITVDIVGSLQRIMAAEILAGEVAVTRAVTIAGRELQKGWRGQIASAGLGQRLARTVRMQVYPAGEPSMGAASLSWTRAPVVIGAFEEGPLIRSKDGFWLAIPLGTAAEARGPGNKRITPGGWEQRFGRRLKFIYRKGRFPLLVDTGEALERGFSDPFAFEAARRRFRKNVWTPVFVLVPQVRLQKRLDIARLAREAEGALPGLIVANWRDP